MTNYVQITKNPIPVHEYAALVPLATEPEQISLTLDIKENGQREPIVIWKGKVVDGRCRQIALLSLNRDLIYKELDDTLTDDEVKLYVKSVNTRRSLTITQKLIIAAKEYLTIKSSSVKKLSITWGVSASSLDNTIWLSRNFPHVIEPLFNGLSVEILDNKGREYYCNKITSIYAFYRKKTEKIKEDKQHGWKEGSRIKTQAGKEWYYSKVTGKGFDIETRQDYEELTNYKFKLPKKSYG